MIPERVKQRVLALMVDRDPNECWISDYSLGSHGYAQIGWRNSGESHHMTLLHIVANGEIPKGLTVDHKECRNRPCFNPSHLQLLSNVDNARDNGQGRKTHCPSGHEYTSENTRLNKRGHRFCRKCQSIRNLDRSWGW